MRRLQLLACLLLLPLPLFADADRADWVGSYAMNHDGHLGTLRIAPSRRVCSTATCAGLDLFYTDEQGSTFPARASVLDNSGQHMAFTINFGSSPQPFDVYIFSSDKSRIAGTTIWNGRTFGVTAVKAGTAGSPDSRAATRASNREAAAAIGSIIGAMAHSGAPAASAATGSPAQAHTLSPDGSMEIRKPDGSIHVRRIGASCDSEIRYPDGRVVKPQCIRAGAMVLVPPPPIAGSPQESWLRGQDQDLVKILQGLLGGASSSNYQNYLKNYETPAEPLLYKRIYYRTKAITELTAPQ